MSPQHQVALAALLRVQRRLAPPQQAVEEALAFLELPRAYSGVALGIVRAKTRESVMDGLSSYLHRYPLSECATTLHRIGWDLGEAHFESCRGLHARWEHHAIREIFDAWIEGAPDICDVLYAEDVEAA